MNQKDKGWRCMRVLYGSNAYLEAVELRREVLRRPLGLDFSLEDLAAEEPDEHWICSIGVELAGCFVLRQEPAGQLRVRQVAVAGTRQGAGVGTFMMECAQERGRALSSSAVVLHARFTAIPFYESLGFEGWGKIFEEIGLPHRQMMKSLKEP